MKWVLPLMLSVAAFGQTGAHRKPFATAAGCSNTWVQRASYAFTIVENPLSDGGNFTSEGDPLPNVPSSGVCQPNTVGVEYGAIYTAITWPAAQYSEITVLNCGSVNALCPIIVRSNGSGTSYYFQLSGNNINSFFAIVSGVKHSLGNVSMSQTTGDVIRLTVTTGAASNTIAISKNGVVQATFNDPTYYASINAGSPGFALLALGQVPVTGSSISKWAGGDCQ